MPSRSRPRSAAFPSAARVPVYLTPAIGRDGEVEEVRRLLRTRRLVSLVGAGGTGKTRLAAAVTVPPGGPGPSVAWIDLTALRDPELVGDHIASTLGLREHVATTPLDAVTDLLSLGSPLLVLDNCEHLVAACARMVEALLGACPSLRILATSRQALGIPGERVWPVPPLAVPDGDGGAALQAASVRLFVERAQDAVPDFVLTADNAPAVARICRRLDGLPLAIELAAARVRVLSPDQLATRLDSMLSLLATGSHAVLPRHRTLRALMDWSYALLSPEERCLLQRLSVFVGGMTLEAVEAVAGHEPIERRDVLDLLSGLAERSLITVTEESGEARYSLLETVRQYALERLDEGVDREGLRERHAAYFLQLAETAEPHVLGGIRGTPWMSRLERELGNLRAAMEWCAERSAETERELRFGAALHWLHFAFSHFGEPRRRLDHALARAGSVPPRLRGRALVASGYLAFWMGDHAAVHAPLDEAVRILRGCGAPNDLAFALTGLGTIVGLAGNVEAARGLFDEAEDALGDPARFPPEDFPRALLYAFGSYWRGAVAQAHGDLASARASYETSVRVARQFGDHPTIGHPLTALARVLVHQGDLDGARACLSEAAPILARHEDRWGLVQAAAVGTLLLARDGAAERAARLMASADALRSGIGAVLAPHEQLEREAVVEALLGALGRDDFQRALQRGAGEPIHELLRSASTLEPTAPDPLPAYDGEESGGALPWPEPPEPADLRVRALGPVEIHVDERPLAGEAFVSGKPRELLMLLLCHPGGLTREQVGLIFWPDASASQVKNSFHVTVHRLRKALGRPDWIQADADRYRLDPRLVVDFDVWRFESEVERWLEEGRASHEGMERLRAALAVYRGDFLDGETVGDWHLDLRDRLRRRRHDALLAVGRFEIARERFAAAVGPLRAVLASDRLHEEACRQLMVCLARTGARTEALRLYETFRLLLREELGTEPEPATDVLYQGLRAGGTETAARPTATDVSAG